MEQTVQTYSDLLEIIRQISFKNTVLDFKWAFKAEQMICDSYSPYPKLSWLIHVTFERPKV